MEERLAHYNWNADVNNNKIKSKWFDANGTVTTSQAKV